jgi:hypothetical protein
VTGFGYQTQTAKAIRVFEGGSTTQDFALISAPRHMLSGTVTTPAGAPAAGVQVTIQSTPIPPTRTDDQGSYAFVNVPEGTYMIQISGGGCFGSQTQSVDITDDLVLNLVVPQRHDTFGYTCTEGVPFEWIPGDTLSPLTGDDSIRTDPLPFTFNYYGTDYTSVNYSTDIYASFGPPQESFTSQCLPSASAVHGLVGVAWEDGFIPPGRIWTKVQGDPGNRIFVIEWRDVGYYASQPTDIITAEIIFWEGTNNITFQYLRTDGRGDGRNSTVGIQNTTGTDAFQYSCHQATLSVGKRLDFIHP